MPDVPRSGSTGDRGHTMLSGGKRAQSRGGVFDELPTSVQRRWLGVAEAMGGVVNDRKSLKDRVKGLIEQWKGRGGDPTLPPSAEEARRVLPPPERSEREPEPTEQERFSQGRQELYEQERENSVSQTEMNPDHVLFSTENQQEELGRVRTIQDQLGQVGYDPGGVDGHFGPGTEAAVRQFQEAEEGLEATGKMDMQTMQRLRERFMEQRGGGQTTLTSGGGR